MLIEKEIISPAVHWYRDEATGQPRKLVVTPELTRHWHDQGNKMIAHGLTVPVPCEHDFDAHPMTPADKLKQNAGWVTGYKLKDIPATGKSPERKDVLFGMVDIQDAELAKKLPTTIRWTSPWISSFTDGDGRDWKNVISHLALTTRPRIVKQAPFGSIAAALSLAKPTKKVPKSGYTLSKAGRLVERDSILCPEYPMAFSLYSGVALAAEHDKTTGQFTGPGKGGGREKMIGDLHDEVTSRASAASDKAHGLSKKSGWGNSHSERAVKASGKKKHDMAAKAHRTAAKELEKIPGAADEAKAHHDAYHAHAYAHHIKGIPMAIGDDLEDDDFLDNDDEDDEGIDIDGDGDSDIDAPPIKKGKDGEGEGDDANPFGDQEGDIPPPIEGEQGDTIPITELLSQLLPILGVQMPDARFITSDTFMRELCTAMISKVTLLAQANQQQQQPAQPNQPNPTQPKPGQPGQPNPLIQQEQQPMYMSLEDISKITDKTMKSIALSMYNENVKLRGELEAGTKLGASLRDAKLKEENAKRIQRVTLLGKLSPRVKADLDTMSALPGMALSMGDGGVVVDPMEQTLAVLEKGLQDMPRLLMTDQSALSVQPQPTDGEMSAEQIDKTADDLARMMGCPQEQKKAG